MESTQIIIESEDIQNFTPLIHQFQKSSQIVIFYETPPNLINFFDKIIEKNIDYFNKDIVIIPCENYDLHPNQIEDILNNKIIQNFQGKFYVSYYDDNLKYNLFHGHNIFLVLNDFINKSKNYNHLEHKKSKKILTLNNNFNPSRENLYYLIKSLPNKDDILYSFNFKGLFLEKENFVVNELSERIEGKNEKLFLDDSIKYYKNSLIEIISETSHDIASEKTLKPLLMGVPFILYNFFEKDKISGEKIIKFYKKLGIDINYFNNNFKTRYELNYFIKSLSNMSTEEIKNKFQKSFDLAKKNQIITHEYVENIKQQLKNYNVSYA